MEAKKEADVESGASGSENGKGSGKSAPLFGVNRPFFHVDVQAALDSAYSVVEQQETST